MELLFATTNPHKIAEVKPVLARAGFKVVSLDSLGMDIPEPVEDAPTFEQNARIKAMAYARATGQRCLAEDSGLAVDALDGAPGVHSARFSGATGARHERDLANNNLLLERLEGVAADRRSARFVCAMCVAEPDGKIVAEASGHFEGQIGLAPRGDNGFGYDPLLFLPEVGCTSAELSPEDKNARSHRGAAVRALLRALGGALPGC